MSHNTSESSPTYVFVVLSLAAFLTLFTFCRKPGIAYETELVLRLRHIDGQAVGKQQLEQASSRLESLLLQPEFVLDAMRSADIIRAETTPETLRIARSITDRMQLRPLVFEDQAYTRLTLVTERPRAGITLLDSMSQNVAPEFLGSSHAEISPVPYPATIARLRGGSISAYSLFKLLVASSVVGMLGLLLCKRAKDSPILVSTDQVREVAGLPVFGDFFDKSELGAPQKEELVRKRTFAFALRAAEVGVAAVFALMVYHLATRDALFDRFLSDPLAAYGEVLTYVIG